MTLQKIEFEYDIPDGYRFVRFGKPKCDESYLNDNGEVCIALSGYCADYMIVEKIPEQEQPKLKLQYKTQQGDWRDVIDGYEYRIKPKTKTVRFRNYLNVDGKVDVVGNNDPFARLFKQWLGDWQEAEVEE